MKREDQQETQLESYSLVVVSYKEQQDAADMELTMKQIFQEANSQYWCLLVM